MPGTWVMETGYRAFQPSLVNEAWQHRTPALNIKLERAANAIGELKANGRILSKGVDLFIHLHSMKEAVVSSKIEGTRTEMDQALLPEAEVSPEMRDDWQEVQNYNDAMAEALTRLADFPLSNRLLRDTHKILMKGVRGDNKQPGEFRRSQNWIGGRTLHEAAFVPPPHHMIQNLMSDLEAFLHNERTGLPVLLKAGIAHYQFETIHPFLDGNGRVGRLLIPLFLIQQGQLTKPLLYISSHFLEDKAAYYGGLTRAREQGGLVPWLLYFLDGVYNAATAANDNIAAVLDLQEQYTHRVQQHMGQRSGKGLQVLQHVMHQVFIRVSDVMTLLDCTATTAGTIINELEKAGVLELYTKGRQRNRIYYLRDLLNLYR